MFALMITTPWVLNWGFGTLCSPFPRFFLYVSLPILPETVHRVKIRVIGLGFLLTNHERCDSFKVWSADVSWHLAVVGEIESSITMKCTDSVVASHVHLNASSRFWQRSLIFSRTFARAWLISNLECVVGSLFTSTVKYMYFIDCFSLLR